MRVNDLLVNQIEEKIQVKNQLVSLVSLALRKSPSSIYRRIKGEVPFTFEEATILAKHFDISLDKLIENHTSYNIIEPQINIIDKDEIKMSFPIPNNYSDTIFEVYDNECDTEHGALSPTIPYTFFASQSMFAIEANIYNVEKSKKIKRWMDSMKRLSTKISNSSYLERTEFFDLQKKYINYL